MRKLYPTRRTEPDMRAELEYTFDGRHPEISKRQWAVLRKMRRDAGGNLIKCPCVDPTTHEPDLDSFCPVCWGEGNLWDEDFMPIYRIILSSDVGLSRKERLIAPGNMNIQMTSFFTTYEQDITKDDKVVELVLEAEGQPTVPYQRKKLHRIGTPVDFRSDNGKLEYWKLDCFEEDRKFLNGASM